MTEKRSMSGSYRNRSHSTNKSNGYHPYRNNGRYPSNSNSSGSTRVVSVKEALKSERILSIESFAHVERINETEASHEYSLYVQKHVKNFLKNIYSRHKKEKWISQIISGKLLQNSFTTANWDVHQINLQYKEEFGMQLDDSSNETNFSSGTETRLLRVDSDAEGIPDALKSIVPEFSKQLITMSNIPPYVDGEALERHLHEYAPNATIEITAPNADKSFYRLAWLKLNEASGSSEELNDLIPKLESLGSIDGAKVYFGILSSNFRRFKVTKYLAGTEAELASLALKIIKLFEPEFNESMISDEEATELLDKSVFHLRKVHNFCFYCVTKFSCQQEMCSKCGDLHLRSPISDDGSSHHEHYKLVEKNAAFIDFLVVLHSLSVEADSLESVEDVLAESSVSKIEEGKYRCVHCSKAFKGPEFVLKHLNLKHEDVLQQTKIEIEEFANLLKNAPLWIFPSTMIPRYTKIRSRVSNSARSSESRKSSVSSNRSSSYNDWDSVKSSSTEIDYDL